MALGELAALGALLSHQRCRDPCRETGELPAFGKTRVGKPTRYSHREMGESPAPRQRVLPVHHSPGGRTREPRPSDDGRIQRGRRLRLWQAGSSPSSRWGVPSERQRVVSSMSNGETAPLPLSKTVR